MSCSQCTQSASPQCAHELTFKVDGQYLAPYIGGSPIEPIDLQPLIIATETDTTLQVDVPNKQLVYTGERAVNGGTPDAIPIASIAALIALKELGDVEYGVAVNGDFLIFNSVSGVWEAYTVPDGTIVSSIGIDADGKPVKSLAAAPLPGSVEVPIGGSIIWTLAEADLPSNFKLANGQALSRTVYATYFALVGTTYGAGNGSTTFNILNLKGRVPVGLDAAQTEFDALGETGGAKSVTLSASQMPVHNHGLTDPGHGHAVHDPGHSHSLNGRNNPTADGVGVEWTQVFDIGRSGGVNASGTGISIGGSGTGIFLQNAGGGLAHENMPPYVTVNYAVRVI